MNDLYEFELDDETRRGPRGHARAATAARPRPRGAPPVAACQCPVHDQRFVRWVQGALNRSRGLRLPLDGQLGPATRSALRTLLDKPADDAAAPGVPDTATDSADAPESEWQGEISRSSRDYVMWVQASLNRLLGLSLAVDGISGTMTRAAVRDFQTRQRLGVDGVVGPVTEAALLAAGATAPPGGTTAPAPSAPSAPAAPGPAARWTVPESALTSLLPSIARYTYDLSNPRYPSPLPGVSLPLAPPEQTNCCCFAEWFIAKAFASHVGSAFQWGSQRHGQMMIPADFSDRYSPVTAVVQAGIASAIPDGAPPSAWCLVQAWRSSTGGHTLIVVAYHAPSDRVLTLEANNAFGLNGVGCRNFGNLRDLPGGRPPARWWEDSRAPTWSSLRASYGYGLRMAKLGVSGPSWAGLPS